MRVISILLLALLLGGCGCDTVEDGFECYPVGNTTICEPKYVCKGNSLSKNTQDYNYE